MAKTTKEKIAVMAAADRGAAIETKGLADTFDVSKGRELPRYDAQAVPNDDTGHEWATRHHLFIYEVDFGEEGKGRYIRLSDFNKVCEKLERAAQAVPEDMCLVTKEDGNNYCLILTALGMEEEGDPVAEVKRLAASQSLPEGVARIAAERVRQIENEGFTPNLDRHNYSARQPSQIILAAIAYLSHAGYSPDFREAVRRRGGMFLWPWDASWWKPGKDDSNASRVRELEKAGALIAAEIDRLLAAEPTGEVE